jgi:hypothetical protein
MPWNGERYAPNPMLYAVATPGHPGASTAYPADHASCLRDTQRTPHHARQPFPRGRGAARRCLGGWFLEAYRRDDEGWRGMVRYCPTRGAQYLQWRPAEQLNCVNANRGTAISQTVFTSLRCGV